MSHLAPLLFAIFVPAVTSVAAALAPSRPLAACSLGVSTPPPAHSVARLREATAYLGHYEAKIDAALDFATEAHDGQRRKSGEPFIVHPVEVAAICADLKMDCDTVVAGLLHDTVEDTPVTLDDIRVRFGDGVAAIVAGVTDSKALPDRHNQRNQLMAMSEDWRIVMLKLADRLHNMRTLQHMPRIKQQRKARDTLSVYVPLARSVGAREIEDELLQQSADYLLPRISCPRLRLGFARLRWRPTLDSLVSHDVEAGVSSHRATWAAHCACYR